MPEMADRLNTAMQVVAGMNPTRRIARLSLMLLTVAAVALSPALSWLAETPSSVHGSPAPSALSSPPGDLGTTLLQAASSSLASGAGPAQGEGWRCSSIGGGSLSCDPGSGSNSARFEKPSGFEVQPTVVHPSVSAPAEWYNQTFQMNGFFGGESYTVNSAAAAFDPFQQEVILFGGCSPFQCPSNQTWIYNGSEWENYTGLTGLTPPAVYGEGLTWDPQFTTIIMTGGILTNGKVTNATWDFNGNDWQNMTQDQGADFFFGEGTAFAATAYDPALNELVVVDGCALAGCTSIFDYVEVLTEAGGWTGGAHLLNPGTWHSEQYLWGSSMAYDPTDKELVLFGGVSNANNSTVNWTFILNDTGWYNITS